MRHAEAVGRHGHDDRVDAEWRVEQALREDRKLVIWRTGMPPGN
jgi:hypothetical protein